jgi:hypothetical protein
MFRDGAVKSLLATMQRKPVDALLCRTGTCPAEFIRAAVGLKQYRLTAWATTPSMSTQQALAASRCSSLKVQTRGRSQSWLSENRGQTTISSAA